MQNLEYLFTGEFILYPLIENHSLENLGNLILNGIMLQSCLIKVMDKHSTKRILEKILSTDNSHHFLGQNCLTRICGQIFLKDQEQDMWHSPLNITMGIVFGIQKV